MSHVFSNTKQTPALFLLLALFSLFFGACGAPVVGSGELMTQTLHYKNYTRVEIHSSLHVRVEYGETFSGRIEADGNLLELVEIEQHGEVLQIRLRGNAKIVKGKAEVALVMPRLAELRVVAGNTVHLPKLQTRGRLRLDISGGSTVSGICETDGLLDIELSGASVFRGRLKAQSLVWKLTGQSGTASEIDARDTTLDASGGSRVDFRGRGERFKFELAGMSSGLFEDFALSVIDAKLSGSSTGLIKHDGVLTALIEGLSQLYYLGTPKVEGLKTTGGGKLLPRREEGDTAPSNP